VIWQAIGSELSALHLIAYSVYNNFGFGILDFTSHFIELLHINLSKVIGTNYNKNNQTAQLCDSHIILE